MKKTFFIAILIVIFTLIIFNFFGAREAGRQIETLVRNKINQPDNGMSLQYSSLNISPFGGNMTFKNITFVNNNNIERCKKLTLNMSYWDFLNIYLDGVESGLQSSSKATLTLIHTSFIKQPSLHELSVDSLHVLYKGPMWDAIHKTYEHKPYQYDHTLNITASGVDFARSKTVLGTFSADSVQFDNFLPKGTSNWRTAGKHSLRVKNITWDIPQSVQKKYSFFINGFGYQSGHIPISEVAVTYTSKSPKTLDISNGLLKSNQFTMHFQGTAQIDSSLATTKLEPMNISITNFSPKFKTVLQNLQKLLNVPSSGNGNSMKFQLKGPLTQPKLTGQQ